MTFVFAAKLQIKLLLFTVVGEVEKAWIELNAALKEWINDISCMNCECSLFVSQVSYVRRKLIWSWLHSRKMGRFWFFFIVAGRFGLLTGLGLFLAAIFNFYRDFCPPLIFADSLATFDSESEYSIVFYYILGRLWA